MVRDRIRRGRAIKSAQQIITAFALTTFREEWSFVIASSKTRMGE